MAQNDVLESTRVSDTLKYSEARTSRKHAEDHFRQLSNRIAFLKKEADKLKKTIKNEQIFAKELASRHARHSSLILQKQDYLIKHSENINIKKQQNSFTKKKIQENIEQKTKEKRKLSKKKAEIIKETSHENQNFINSKRLEENLKKIEIRQKLLAEQKRVREAKKIEELRKRSESKAEIERKIDQEHLIKFDIEDKIDSMQIEEIELIQKLHATQMIQRSIYENIEEDIRKNK